MGTATITCGRCLAFALVVAFGTTVIAGSLAARHGGLVRAAFVAWHGARLVEVGGVLQLRDNDCGPAALAHALRGLGHEVPYPDPASPLPIGPTGCRMDDLAVESRRLGESARLVRFETRDLSAVTPPAILYLARRRHFVVWEGREPGGRQLVHDPAYGRVSYGPGQLERRWSGVAVVFGAPSATVGQSGTR